MKHNHGIVFMLMLVIFSYSSMLFSQEYPSVDDIAQVIKNEVDNNRSNSIAVGIFDNGEEYFVCYGNPIKGQSQRASENTIYEIASISKIFTNILFADLVIEGKLNLEDPVISFLPDSLIFQDKRLEKMNLQHLATHTSGLPRRFEEIDLRKMDNYHREYTYNDLLASLEEYQFNSDPGTEFYYSNKNTALLAYVICSVTKKDLESLIQEKICTPFQMKNTTLYLTENQEKVFATAYDRPGRSINHWEWNAEAGAGGLRSNSKDLIVFLRRLFYDDSPLNEAANFSVIARFDSTQFRNTKIGLGWFISPGDDHYLVSHGGETYGFKSLMVYDLRKNRGVTVLSNSSRDIIDIGLYCFDKNYKINEFRSPVSLAIDSSSFKSYKGKYIQERGGIKDTIEVYDKEGLYFLYAPGEGEFEMFYQGRNTFLVDDLKIKFKKFQNNQAQIITCNNKGIMRGKRIVPNEE